jgi:DNA mismatch repair protein MutL
MMRIQSLASNVVDQIAAGEVVEKPAHLVKELVENSLDAKATEISLEFSEGGREVTVVDNGSGIHPEDLKKALDRHATSKILSTDDLWKLKTFGFRGEALASIAAVSKLTLSSKILSDDAGRRILCDYGILSDANSVGHSQGTRVQVSKLFENVPARLKFMRSQAAESTQIKNVMKALALANPQVTFRVTQEGQLLFMWAATPSKMERAKQILGVDSLFEGEAARDSVKAYAIFSDPNTTAKTSKNIWLFAQNRWIQDRSLQAAVMEAYRHLLMHGEYPIAAIWVDTPTDQIDVNMHPTKSQVKFLEPSLAFRAVQASVRDTLEKAPWLPKVNQTTEYQSHSKNFEITKEAEPAQNLTFADSEFSRTQFAQKQMTQNNFVRSYQTEIPQQKISLENIASLKVESLEFQTPVKKQGYWSSLQVLGQAGQTYMICQSAEGLVLVDQHAAHERVMFEKLMTTWKSEKPNVEIQNYLIPIVMDLSPEKYEALMLGQDDLQKFGIQIEQMGPMSVGIKAAPAILKESAIVKAVEKLIEETMEQGGSYQMENTIAKVSATMACHSAIRAGQAQSIPEMKSLLNMMDEYPLSSFCPHGRPVSVQYSFNELEKDFGRIV